MVPLARQRPCLPLWGRCPSAHAGADEVGTHRRFIPTPNKQNCRCPALLFPSILLKVHTSLGAFQPHPTRLAPGHLPQRGRLCCAKRSFTAHILPRLNSYTIFCLAVSYVPPFQGFIGINLSQFPPKAKTTPFPFQNLAYSQMVTNVLQLERTCARHRQMR